MRYLNITRKKKIVASLAKVYVYIDETYSEKLSIDKKKLKELPVLKNGDSISLEVPSEPFTLYIIFDKFYPERFNSGLMVSEGNHDITVETYPKYNPFNGNAFGIYVIE